MKLLLPSVLVLLSVAQALCEDSLSREDPDYWSQDNQIQDGWPATEPLREILRRWTRKPRPNQFVGLMGKRSPANAQMMTRKRHKINSFVGLMGKRSQEEPDQYDWSTIQDLERKR